MILGIMQPYFFPHLDYFSHIANCDKWVVFDISQYTPRSWMTRNRILHPTRGWQYVGCDVHGSQSDLISNVKIVNSVKTKKRLLGQLGHYKKKAPYYNAVISVIEKAFCNISDDFLTTLNIETIKAVCDYLSIHFDPLIASKSNFDLPKITHPGQWALEISMIMQASVYINPPGGRDLFRPEKFAKQKIQLAFTQNSPFKYSCSPYKFESQLSILDVLMWNSPKEIKAAIGAMRIEYVS